MTRVPFKLRSQGSSFKEMGSSPVRQDDEKQIYVTREDYAANVDTLQAFQHQNIGKPDPANTGPELAILDMIEREYGKDSNEYKTFKSKKRVHGDEDDFKKANTKLGGHPISYDSYHKAKNIYWNAIRKD
jgi:hypothetical protein